MENKEEGKLGVRGVFTLIVLVLFILAIGEVSSPFSWLGNKFTNDDSSSYIGASCSYAGNSSTNIVTNYEMERLFPDTEEDWEFVQDMVGTSGLRMPNVVYQTNTNLREITSSGMFHSDTYTVSLDRKFIFSTTTPAYPRYVMIHELTHAAISMHDWFATSSSLFINLNSHCYMADRNMFIKIGKQIKDQNFGKLEQEKYTRHCNS